jgi:hypothetical protein
MAGFLSAGPSANTVLAENCTHAFRLPWTGDALAAVREASADFVCALFDCVVPRQNHQAGSGGEGRIRPLHSPKPMR